MIGTTFFRTLINIFKEEFEDTKAVIRIRISKKTTHWQKKVQKKNNDLHKTKWNTCITDDHRYVPLVVNTSRSFPHSWRITGFVTRSTRRVSIVEQELLTLPENQSSPPVLNGVRVTRSLVLCRSLFFFCTFFWFHSGQPSHGCDRKAFEMMIST
jgi:hypothetical protein